jgi:cysteine desulfurase
MEPIYFDYNSTTPVDPAVVEIMKNALADTFGNPSSLHRFGQKAKSAMENARERVGAALGVPAADICFTSGGTEADNIAVKGVALARQDKGRHIITSKIEHHAVLESAHHLEQNGFEVTWLECDENGVIPVSNLEKALRPDTTIVSIMMANNETGMIQPITEMAALCREKGVVFHTDAVQAVGKIPVNIDDLGVDMLSLSAHKFYGPKGIGALYIHPDMKLTSLAHGGSHERGRRAGTESVTSIIGMAAALELATEMLDSESRRLTDLADYFIAGVTENIPDVRLNGSHESRVPSTINLAFKGVEGEAIVLALDMKGIAVSSGSACTSGSIQASHVLTAMNIDPLLAQGSIRFSMGRFTTREQIDYTLSVLPEIIERLRSMSAAYDESK